LTAAVGRKTGVADRDGAGRVEIDGAGLAEIDGNGLAEIDGAGDEARVVGTGFTVPATKAVALGDGLGTCP
jgi:hypothetical protein